MGVEFSAWDRRFSEKLNKLRDAGDTKGEDRLFFGSYVRHMRLRLPEMSQSKAAKLAGISRSQWARIEAGKHIPRQHKIADMADAIRVKVSALYRKAGYEVPDKYAEYDLKEASKDFAVAIREAPSVPEFIARMQEVWQLFWQEDKSKPKAFTVDRGQARLLAAIFTEMNAPQRIKLARALARSVPEQTLRAAVSDPDFLKEDIEFKAAIADHLVGLL